MRIWALMFIIILELIFIVGQELRHFPSMLSMAPTRSVETKTYLVPVTEQSKLAAETEPIPFPKIETGTFHYAVVKESCGVHYQGECVRVRSGPGTEYPVVSRLRNNMVLKIGGSIVQNEQTWYQIVFDEWLRYPERVTDEWFVSGQYIDVVEDEGDKTVWEDAATSTNKYILVDKSEQKLYAYDGETLFMETTISTGLDDSPTPLGSFKIFKKTPSRYMQGPLPGYTDEYDLPGVPWNMYFTEQGAVIHGAYWHDSFGQQYSHGCVNMVPEEARQLYKWAELGTKVRIVH